MTELAEVVGYLDDYLRIREIPDAPHALNGLQLSNAGTVSRVAAAVDLCRATVLMAAEQGADLLLVHHGLFWGGLRPLTGRDYGRVAPLVSHNIAVYSAHLPLDLHPEVGNNSVLARQLGFQELKPFFFERGAALGVAAEIRLDRADPVRRLEGVLGRPGWVAPGGPAEVRCVGQVT